MVTSIGNYELELSGSLIMVRVDGELRLAQEVNPLNAVEIYNELVTKYEKAGLIVK